MSLSVCTFLGGGCALDEVWSRVFLLCSQRCFAAYVGVSGAMVIKLQAGAAW